MFGEELNLREYWHIIKKRRWMVITLTFIIAVSVTILAFRQTSIYQAAARILIENAPPTILSYKDDPDLDISSNGYYQTQYEILTSRTLARKALERLGLLEKGAEPEKEETQREERIITNFLKAITVAPIRDSRLVDVSAKSIHRKNTAMFANTLVDVYIEQNLANNLSTTKDAATWLSKELELTRQKLVESEAALHAYKEEHDIISIDDRQNSIMQKLTELNTAVNSSKIERAALESEYKKIRQYGVTELENIPAVMQNEFIQELRAERSRLEHQLSELQENFRETPPSAEALRTQIVSVRKRINSEVARVVSGLKSAYDIARQKEVELITMLEAQKIDVLDLSGKLITYKELQREVETNRQIYDMLQRVKDAGISEHLKSSNIQVLDRAMVPVVPMTPNKKRTVIMGLLLGLAAGLAMAFFLEFLNNTMKSGHAAKQYPNMPNCRSRY